jgi:hypothetical protein
MNRGTIRDEIRRLIRDTDTTNPRWSTTELNSRIDLAHDVISSETKCIPYRYTASLVADTAEYLMPDYYLDADRVMYLDDNSDWRPLEKKTEFELDEESNNWRSESGTSKYWYQRIGYIGIVPYPTAAKTDGLRVDMFRLPTAFTADADIPFDSVKEMYPYHEAICVKVALSCALDEGNEKTYVLFKKEFEDYIRKINSQVGNKSSNSRMPNVYDSLRSNNRRVR